MAQIGAHVCVLMCVIYTWTSLVQRGSQANMQQKLMEDLEILKS